MPVLISLGNGYMKMIDDGRSPDDPSGYRFLDVKSAPLEVKQEIMGEIDGLRGSIMHAGEAPPMPPKEGKPAMPGAAPQPKMPKPPSPPQGLPPDLMAALQGGGPGPLPDMTGPSPAMGPGPMQGPPPDMPMDMPMGPGPGYQRRGY